MSPSIKKLQKQGDVEGLMKEMWLLTHRGPYATEAIKRSADAEARERVAEIRDALAAIGPSTAIVLNGYLEKPEWRTTAAMSVIGLGQSALERAIATGRDTAANAEARAGAVEVLYCFAREQHDAAALQELQRLSESEELASPIGQAARAICGDLEEEAIRKRRGPLGGKPVTVAAAERDDGISVSATASGETLELFPESFHWQGEEFPYEEVVHLGRRAKRTNVNLIPVTDSLDISIQVRYRPEPFEVSALGFAWSTRKMDAAYKALAEATFQSRLSPYLEQLEETGSFEYGQALFHRSGKVGRVGRIVDLESGKLRWEPFEMHIKGKGAFASEIVVSTLVDQDVLFYLMKELYGISFR